MDYDLKIYYSGTAYIEGRTSRYDQQDYSIIFETWLKKSDLNTLRDNIRPGATAELYNVLGKPRFYDKTWVADNTIRIKPNYSSNNSNSNLMYMREEQVIYVKNISDSPIKGGSGWLNLKIEGYISGSTL